MSAARDVSEAPLTRVMVAPDWADPRRTRWQVEVQDRGLATSRTFATEEDARTAAFEITGVGDFPAGVTWVRGTGFRPLPPA
jgi:hypothetical protein